jgi:hypothetical protein
MSPGKRQSFASKIRPILISAAGAAVIILGAIWYVAFDVDHSTTAASLDPKAGRFANSQVIDSNAEVPADVNERLDPSTGSSVGLQEDAFSSQRESAANISSSNVTPMGESTGSVESSEDPSPAGIGPVGNPFPISRSVKDSCDRISHLGKASCGDIFSLLELLQKESRDSRWAKSMEQLIRDLVSAQPGYSIRALDCRSTVCAVEVESTWGVFRPNKRSLRGRLYWVDQNFGYEVNDNNERVKVTLVVLQRE